VRNLPFDSLFVPTLRPDIRMFQFVVVIAEDVF
jgi:hypothetical protein